MLLINHFDHDKVKRQTPPNPQTPRSRTFEASLEVDVVFKPAVNDSVVLRMTASIPSTAPLELPL
jgi:hypothetical protein